MSNRTFPAARFEEHRPRLRAIAFRMLGASGEAEDAVQETWLRLHRAGAEDIDRPDAWLTTVLSRICLDMLRKRQVRREYPFGEQVPDVFPDSANDGPEDLAVRNESLERAVLVLLHRLSPAERIAFVLHDMFQLPFDDIATVLERSPNAARLLASRARHRVLEDPAATTPQALRERRIVRAFLAAARAGDLETLLTLLDPEITIAADRFATPAGTAITISGARTVGQQAVVFAGLSDFGELVVVDGLPGALVAAGPHPPSIMGFVVHGDLITRIDVIADPDSLAHLHVTLPGPSVA
ncbi:sigma-70 family RNA polymerase sigma factor [Nocardia sp. NPDC088792]|uniref:sigma-70 family RNA polymerase sigma factor n=1 Tax=Nocardia sp. NPDC088792 TaxID=3364332 RepID=UPI003801AC89